MRLIWHIGLLMAVWMVQVSPAATVIRGRMFESPAVAGPVSVRLEAKESTYKLDPAARIEPEYLKAIKNRTAKRLRVELQLVITNRSASVIRVQTHGNEVNRWLAGYTLTLEGPGAVTGGPYWSEKSQRQPPTFVTLKPGEETAVSIPTLTCHSAGVQLYDCFWTKPGTYVLSAMAMLPVDLDWGEKATQRVPAKTMRLQTPPIRLAVEE